MERLDVLEQKNTTLTNNLDTGLNRMEYHVGDFVEYNSEFISWPGHISNGGKSLRITIILDKPIGTDVKSISLSHTSFFRHVGGSSIVLDVEPSLIARENNVLVYEFVKESGWGITNNTPVTFHPNRLKLTFGE